MFEIGGRINNKMVKDYPWSSVSMSGDLVYLTGCAKLKQKI